MISLLRGDSHPKMQASDRELAAKDGGHKGDSHPKMQASDRMLCYMNVPKLGDSHPEMQASDGGNYEPKLTSKGVPPEAYFFKQNERSIRIGFAFAS